MANPRREYWKVVKWVLMYIKRSLRGYCFSLFGNVVSWRSSLQSIVALSTMEVEFMAIIEAT